MSCWTKENLALCFPVLNKRFSILSIDYFKLSALTSSASSLLLCAQKTLFPVATQSRALSSAAIWVAWRWKFMEVLVYSWFREQVCGWDYFEKEKKFLFPTLFPISEESLLSISWSTFYWFYEIDLKASLFSRSLVKGNHKDSLYLSHAWCWLVYLPYTI